MADGQYDNTNRGALFPPFQDQKLIAQGRIDVDGAEHKAVMVMERIKKDEPPEPVLYIRAAPLFRNDSDNENAPARSGPMDLFPGKRVAVWKKTSQSGTPFYSFAVSDRRGGGGTPVEDDGFNPSRPPANGAGTYGTGAPVDDDDIPF